MMQEESELPTIPEKRYFTIGEVSRLCSIKPHVLRYWEQEFTHIKPSKRNGRRYYQVDDILIIRTIRTLLYKEGFTIVGAKQKLKLGKRANISTEAVPVQKKMDLPSDDGQDNHCADLVNSVDVMEEKVGSMLPSSSFNTQKVKELLLDIILDLEKTLLSIE